MNVLTKVVLKGPFKGFFCPFAEVYRPKGQFVLLQRCYSQGEKLRGQARCLHINLDYESIVCFFNYGFKKKKEGIL